jgi:hypothetical protein
MQISIYHHFNININFMEAIEDTISSTPATTKNKRKTQMMLSTWQPISKFE